MFALSGGGCCEGAVTAAAAVAAAATGEEVEEITTFIICFLLLFSDAWLIFCSILLFWTIDTHPGFVLYYLFGRLRNAHFYVEEQDFIHV